MSRRARFLLCIVLALAALPSAAASATTYNVDLEADVGGTCPPESCTLRQAVNSANAGSGGDLIKIAPGHYTLTLGELQLLKNVTIEGAGPAATVIDGNAASRIFSIPGAAVAVLLSGLTVENGRVLGATSINAKGGGILNSGILTLENVVIEGNEVGSADSTALIPGGGGIHNSGTLRLFDSTIEGNKATTLPHSGGIPQGGGFINEGGQVEITGSVVSGNISHGKSGIPEGAGFYSSASTAHGASVTLTRVVLEGNEALSEGGGIVDGGSASAFRTDLTVRESTIRGNKALGGAISGGAGFEVNREGDFILESSLVADNVAEATTFTNGAGISLAGETTEVHRIVNSTITGNRGTSLTGNNGAGIFHGSGGFGAVRLDVISSTISGNVVSGSGAEDKGANVWDFGTEGSVTSLRDSIVAGGVGAPGFESCSGEGIESAGHNIDSLDQCNFKASGDKVNTNPLLVALADKGGPTATMAIGPESPAIDAGDSCPPTDQRGVARPQGSACDIGAFEYVPPPPKPVVPLASASGNATLRFLSKKAKVGLKSGKGTVGAECGNVPADICQVSLRLLVRAPSPGATSSKKARLIRVGTIQGTIDGGKTGKLNMQLKPKGLAVLAARPNLKLQAIAKGQARNRAGQPTAIEKKLTLKAKPARPRPTARG